MPQKQKIIMNSNERYHKITDLLSKFKNGEEMYKRSALFNRCIQMMVDGATPFETLEQMVLINERTQKAFEDYMNRDTHPVSFTTNKVIQT